MFALITARASYLILGRKRIWPLSLVLLSIIACSEKPPTLENNPLIRIAAGSFVYGNNAGEANEAPLQRRVLPSFKINQYEITNLHYRKFVQHSGRRPSFYHNHSFLGMDDLPVVGISWQDAADFCRFYDLSLPTEEQWERAARGSNGRMYSWGDAPPDFHLVSRGNHDCCNADDGDGFLGPAPVGSFPLGNTPEGLADMTGNVWEWVAGWYTDDHAAGTSPRIGYRVARGGAWNSDPWKLRATYRLAYNGDFRFSATGGFRCATP